MPTYESDQMPTTENMRRLTAALAYWMRRAGDTKLADRTMEAALGLTGPARLEEYLLGIQAKSYYPTWLDNAVCHRLNMKDLITGAFAKLSQRTSELAALLWVADSRGNTLLHKWMEAALRAELTLWLMQHSYQIIDEVGAETGEDWRRPEVWSARGAKAVDEFLAEAGLPASYDVIEIQLFFPSRSDFNLLKRFHNAFFEGYPGQWLHGTYRGGELITTTDSEFATRFRRGAQLNGITVLEGDDIPSDS
jgi:hypothetical protein